MKTDKIKLLGLALILSVTIASAGCGSVSKVGATPGKDIISTVANSPGITLSAGESPGDIDIIAASVLKLEVFDSKGKRITTGTGFVYGEPAMLATSAHVIVNMESMTATTDSGDCFSMNEPAVYIDEDKDFALLKLPDEVSIPALKPASSLPARGTQVITVGSQAGLTNLVTTGIVSGIWTNDDTAYLIFTAPVSSGNSGGPILNYEGELIGMVIGTYDNAQNLNIGLSASEFPETE